MPMPRPRRELTESAVYGLPELNADRIASAALVANPGCYATSVILALAPVLTAGLVDRDRGIISDSKSGVSGAGKEPTARTHFVSVADNFSAYSVFGHRHTGEILEQLALHSSQLIFTPHLLPIPRGILSTIYVYLKREMKAGEIESCFQDFYKGKRWVRILPAPGLPEIQFSVHTNYCDLGFCLAPDGRRLILVSCLGQPAQRRGRTSRAEYEPDVWMGRSGGTAMKIVIKIGGAALEDKDTLKKCAQAVVQLAQDGHQVAVVHGGGSALTRTLKLLGKQSDFVHGLRVTDAETRDVALMVLAGIVNKSLVAAIAAAGYPAIGLMRRGRRCVSCAQETRCRTRSGICRRNLFFRAALAQSHLDRRRHSRALVGCTRRRWQYYNVNADQMAAACAIACEADALIFLTDVAGVKQADGEVMARLDIKQVPGLIEGSVISGGMMPKLEACTQALKSGVGRVRILPASQVEVLPLFYFTKIECGTEVLRA